MASVLFGFPLYSDAGVAYAPSLSGGSWAAPLTNLQDRRLRNYARSTDALAASTQLEVDLKIARAVRLVALCAHNFSSAATVRIRASNAAGSFGAPIYDSGAVAAFPVGEDAESLDGMNVSFVHVLPASATARYWLVEIADTGNPDGYVQVGRLAITGGYQPKVNIEYGAKLGWESKTTSVETDGNAAVYTVRRPRRTAVAALSEIPIEEAHLTVMDMQRRLDKHGQFVFVFDPADAARMMARRAFLAVMRELTPLDYPHFNVNSTGFAIVEEL